MKRTRFLTAALSLRGAHDRDGNEGEGEGEGTRGRTIQKIELKEKRKESESICYVRRHCRPLKAACPASLPLISELGTRNPAKAEVTWNPAPERGRSIGGIPDRAAAADFLAQETGHIITVSCN